MTATSPTTLPASAYRNDPARYEAERRAIFARSWQFVGHESRVRESGRWFAQTLAGFPIVVVRDGEGVLRGHHNVCRHRAAPLVQGEEGVCDGQLTCPYHGWSYALDGRLRSARDFGRAADFDPRTLGLIPVRVETWRGLIFAALESGQPPLAATVAPLERRLAGRDWSDLELVLTRRHPIACNWKTYVENYLEGYHVPSIHPRLAEDIDATRYQVTMDGLAALHEAPQKGPQAVYEGLWGWLWPNIGVNVYGVGVMIERMSPVGAGACRLDYFYLMPKGQAPPPETLELSDLVTAEDARICEAVQINLDAGAYEVGRLSPRHETAVAAFQSFVTRALQPSADRLAVGGAAA